ncbi:MAG TPA: hypothetical protein VNQ57_01790 [Ureibacillus sp.]|nr:hypothetical protein [Ureibacillus sp.]
MKIKLLIVFLLMLPFIFNLTANSSYACSCVPLGVPEEELDKSNFVFSGKVIDIHDSNKDAFEQSSADLLEVRFEVSNTWKGVTETQVIVYSERDSASCGFEFNLNDEYLVYGNEHDGQIMVNLCSRTTLFADASTDLAALGDGEKPTESISSEALDTHETSMGLPLTIFTVVALIIISGGYWIVLKKSRE